MYSVRLALKDECISEVVRNKLVSIIIFPLSKLWKAKFSINCEVICGHGSGEI